MSNYVHIPVMVAEVLAALKPSPEGVYYDGTIGGAGHAAAILEKSAPTGRLLGSDRDGVAVETARERLAPFAGRFEIQQRAFGEVEAWIEANSLDGAMLDLGVSSPQLDHPNRGFSFQSDGPLDMRMDQRQNMTAAQLVADTPTEELARIFWELGGERESRRIARAIVEERKYRPLVTTAQLADLVARVVPRHGQRTHPATKIFQALRMAVNDELGQLERGLAAIWSRLKPGGRLAVITFHSGEDRMVKGFGRALALPYRCPAGVDVPELREPCAPKLLIVTRKAVAPSEEEQSANPRSRSAQLRIFERLPGE